MNTERDLLAAEYVLGTLDRAERDVAARLRSGDEEFAKAVLDWERYLAPLADGISPVPPNTAVWTRIAQKLDGPSGDNVVALRRSLRRWRGATLAASLAAAAIAAIAVLDPDIVRPNGAARPGSFIAAVNREGDLPALVVRVDVASRTIFVRSVEAQTPPDKNLELWFVAAGQAPKSVGVVAAQSGTMPMLPAMDVKDGAFAVSVEPVGGSRTGAPTGPVVYKGKLIPD